MDRKSANEALQQSGFTPQFVAAGMEGFVFDIGDALLAKVWTKKKELSEIQKLRSFYAQLREKRLPFATPQILDVIQSPPGFIISVEERLTGVPLKSILERAPENDILTRKGMKAFFTIVEALQTVGDIPAARQLSLMNEPSLWTRDSTWNMMLGDFVKLRVIKHKTVLNRFVPNLEHKVDRVVQHLNALNATHPGVIHGDLCPENVLVDELTLTPTGLIDFGFLTTSADPLFDAVTSTLFFDMYSPRAQERRKNLGEMCAQSLGQQFREVYPLYKAVYALISSNAYSENGEDGHFRWCMDILNDEETNTIMS